MDEMPLKQKSRGGRRLYKNKNTDKEIYVIARVGNMYHVRYVKSKFEAWFVRKDFKRMFEKIYVTDDSNSLQK